MKAISSKTKLTIFLVASIVVLLSILIGSVLIRDYRITKELTSIAESYGLKDIKISIVGKLPDYDSYEVTVNSSDLESLSYSQMYSLADSMRVDNAYVSKYISDGNTYEIFPYTKSIYKNGTQIHSNYWNSESYKDATKNDDDKTNYTSSYNTSSYSFTPYKPPSKDDDDDPYNAKDYSNEEDFYYDHYDDFFDYYDAEDYYNEHND